MVKALIVEDAPEVIETVMLCLTARWPDVALIATGGGVEAIQLARAVRPDIVLLDLALSDRYGLQVLKEIRAFSAAPVIIITANSDETSRLKSFEMGADDYLVKPFTHVELLGSMSAALGHTRLSGRSDEEDIANTRGLVIDLLNRRVLHGGAEVSLTPTEWKILLALVYDYGRIVPHARIALAGWGSKPVSSSVVQTHVRRLDEKLGDNPHKPGPIQSWGDEGYSFALFA